MERHLNITKTKKATLTILLIATICLSMCAFLITVQASNTVVTGATTSHNYSNAIQNCFKANGLYWIFYIQGSTVHYSTSPDGVTWTQQSSWSRSAVSTGGNDIIVKYSPSLNRLVVGYCVSGSNPYFRCGRPNADGTITWFMNEQAIGSFYNYNDFDIDIDSTGYIWASRISSNHVNTIVRGTNTDGTYGTYGTSSTSISIGSSSNARLCPLGASGAMAVVSRSSSEGLIRVFNGVSWLPQVSTGSNTIGYDTVISLIPVGDDLYFSALAASGSAINLWKYTYASNTVALVNQILPSSAYSTNSYCLSYISASNTAVFVWEQDANTIQYKTCILGNAWSDTATMFSDTGIADGYLKASRIPFDGNILINYITSAGLRFAKYNYLSTTSNTVNSNETGTTATFSSSWFGVGTSLSCWTFSSDISGSYVNSTWTAFSASNNSEAFYPMTLTGALGQVVHYVWYANASDGSQWATKTQQLTLQATVTFYINDGGMLLRNGQIIDNGTTTTYTSPTTLKMIAVPNSASYSFLSFNWTNPDDSASYNNYDFAVTNQAVFTANMFNSSSMWLDSGYDVGWTQGNTTGYTNGYADGWRDGNATGYALGYASGYATGWNEGNATSYSNGYTAGWNNGNQTGYTNGFTSGWNTGWTAGWTTGYTAGWNALDTQIRQVIDAPHTSPTPPTPP